MSALKIEDPMPYFALPDQNGKLVGPESLKGKIVVIFFYPRDNSPGCIIELCSFRDAYEKFKEEDAVLIGVSDDSPGKHRKFRKTYELPFTLLSDKGNLLRKKFGVERGVLSILAGRETFIFDRDLRLREIFRAQFRPIAHVRRSLKKVKELNREN